MIKTHESATLLTLIDEEHANKGKVSAHLSYILSLVPTLTLDGIKESLVYNHFIRMHKPLPTKHDNRDTAVYCSHANIWCMHMQ